jgi:hypothetical protein
MEFPDSKDDDAARQLAEHFASIFQSMGFLEPTTIRSHIDPTMYVVRGKARKGKVCHQPTRPIQRRKQLSRQEAIENIARNFRGIVSEFNAESGNRFYRALT